MEKMDIDKIYDKINHFYYKLLPQAKLARKLSPETIDAMVRESVEVARLGELRFVSRLKDLGENRLIVDALEELVSALLDNLRLGSNDLDYLKRTLAAHCSPPAHLQYTHRIDKRNALREDYLFACSQISCSKQKDTLKAYLKLKQLATVNSINPDKVEREIKDLANNTNSNSSREERRKLIFILTLDESLRSEFFDAVVKICSLVNLDLEVLSSLQPLDLVRGLNNWPIFRTRVVNTISRAFTKTDSLHQLHKLANFVLTLLLDPTTAAADVKKPRKSRPRSSYGDVYRELLVSLDNNVSMSAFYKNELLVYMHARLSEAKRTRRGSA